MSDAVIAEIARRLAVSASNDLGRDRSEPARKEFLLVLTELCAAVRTEREEEQKP